MTRRRALSALALGVAASGALAACRSGSDGPQSAGPPPSPTLNFSPADAAVEVNPRTPVRLAVTDGWLQRAALINADGKVVAGVLNRDRTAFTVTEPLGYAQTYTWSGSVVGQDGNPVEVAATFRTIAPAAVVNGQFQLADGQTVGVAAPIILQFDAPIADKAAVERALAVHTEPAVEGSWAWLPDEAAGSRVHWRSRDYFPAGTTVRVTAPLYGVDFGEGNFGGADSTLDFSIGRRQLVQADAPSHRIRVLTDDGVLFDFPCSYGEGDLPRNVTRSGIHVVTEKYADFWMSNPAAGYTNVHERWAVRISNNGEFIHANPNSADAQGNTNVTNGCINLSTGDAEQYFYTAIYGDPVEVTGTSIELSYADGDIWDWAVDWDEWKSMSALADSASTMNLPSRAPATPSNAPTLSGTPTTTPPATTTTRPATTPPGDGAEPPG
ncbi:L,D-transpeptidase [Mycolicibacterium fallax]|jgi:lipoprotein-anchoring transpeptidase ErfK/SrfK|uniref:L,D-transpeptidase n=1 Tax=Mycolicibacterium fallax TaxID=1793 RepID=A0A1X1RD57_MYCFA|nr:Ig-like domain-containing protein [Mycolicibacterium fallax]ORV03207.1 L,D-transpeptidase [Mycolicibacterium fallax]BBY98783.1 transpeptidase [Mycolicibacterium fallax]